MTAIKSDYKAFNMSWVSLVKGLFTAHTFYAVMLYRIGNFLYRHNIKFLPEIIKAIQLRIFACEISPYAKIGKGFRIFHSSGIVIGHNCQIGDNCTILQNVTMGQNGKVKNERSMPKIGNNVSVYAGACLLGPIEIGNNVDIGANAVVTKDFGSNLVIAGVPAKILKTKTEVES